jgi:nitrous oxide reductase accessory protein NosL
MLKVISIVGALVLFSACSNTENVQPPKPKQETVKKMNEVSKKKMHKPMKMKMFQTVDKKDAILVQTGEHKASCAVCGMNLVKFYKTSYAATHNDKPIQYCSIHCLADHLDEGIEVKNPKVVDTKNLKFIPVLEAYYVVGSDVHGTMSRVSKYAFSSLEDAKAFQAKHGGKIMDFYGALEKAKEDFN